METDRMPRKLSADERAQFAVMLGTSEGKEVVAANLNRLIRRRAAEAETTITAYVVDHVLPTVAANRDATIFLLTVVMDIAAEDYAEAGEVH
jgi:hypothetical protein